MMYHINNDGSVNAKEAITYNFHGCYRGVFRDFDVPIGASVSGPYISNINAYCSVDCNITKQAMRVTGNIGEVCNSKVTLYLNYTMQRVIFQGADFQAFHFQVWGKSWNKNLRQLQGSITLPNNTVAESIYFNPMFTIKDYNTSKNMINFGARNLDHYAEARIILPKDAVMESNTQPSPISYKSSVEMQQSGYTAKYIALIILSLGLLGLLLYMSVVAPIRIYRKYGREPKRNSDIPKYEREIPYNLKAYLLNSLCIGNTGSSTSDAVKSIILDLVRRGYLRIEEIKTKKLFWKAKDVKITFTSKGTDGLDSAESYVYNYYKRYGEGNVLKWSDYSKKLIRTADKMSLRQFLKDVENESKDELEEQNLFNFKGKKKMKLPIIATMGIPIAIFSATGLTTSANYPLLIWMPILSVPFFILGLIYLALPSRVFGRFSEKGLDAYHRGLAMKKFFSSLTSLKRYPPSSVAIWDEQIVYATALGEAKKVEKYLKDYLPSEYRTNSAVSAVLATSFLSSFDRSMAVGGASGSSGGVGGGGSVGGGVGGGGGGAF